MNNLSRPKSIETLLNSDEVIWVINKAKTNLSVTLRDNAGIAYGAQFPKTWIPIPLTEVYPREHLKGSREFRVVINKKLIKVINEEEAQKLMKRAGYNEELERIEDKSNKSSSSSEFGDMIDAVKERSNIKIDTQDIMSELTAKSNQKLSMPLLAVTSKFEQDFSEQTNPKKLKELVFGLLNSLRNMELTEADLSHLKVKYHQYTEIQDFIKEEYDVDKDKDYSEKNGNKETLSGKDSEDLEVA